jgi:hypothetical protein
MWHGQRMQQPQVTTALQQAPSSHLQGSTNSTLLTCEGNSTRTHVSQGSAAHRGLLDHSCCCRYRNRAAAAACMCPMCQRWQYLRLYSSQLYALQLGLTATLGLFIQLEVQCCCSAGQHPWVVEHQLGALGYPLRVVDASSTFPRLYMP